MLASMITVLGTFAAMAAAPFRIADVVEVPGDELGVFHGTPIDQLAVFACGEGSCNPVPFQVDERDAEGLWVLDDGPQPNSDSAPGVFDANDVLLFMAADAGDGAALPCSEPAVGIAIHDPLAGDTGWVYVRRFAEGAPRAAMAYVSYDAAEDRIHGGRVSLGFRRGLPDYLAVANEGQQGGANLLDRFKVRATATFLWGLLSFARSEEDLTAEFVAWRQGPIRVIRRQRQWVRLGWGIRSPTFGSYTYFYRDFAVLPVALRLNFKPTYFFGDIDVRAVLDFRDLRGWKLLVPSLPAPLLIDGVMGAEKAALNEREDSWFALVGPRMTLVQEVTVSHSLASARRRLLYREDATAEPPEDVPGHLPGIGYRLDRWDDVPAGAHRLQSVSYGVPSGIDVRAFMAARQMPLEVAVHGHPCPDGGE